MKRAEVDDFEKIQGQLQSFHQELTGLSKKNPHDGLNTFKLGLMNSLLRRANDLLDGRRPFDDFQQFDESAVPSNSDVLLIVSQYLSALEKLRSDNICMEPGGEWYWELEGKSSQDDRYRTGPPRKIAE
jgi:hypothetical protein